MKVIKNNKFSIILIILILLISIGYALLSTVNKINSSVSLNKIDFSIHFDNVGTVENTATVIEDAHIVENTNNQEIAFSASLSNLGDYYAFTTDIVNDGKIPGKIKSVDITGISDSQKKLVDYSIKYSNSEKRLSTGDRFMSNVSKNVLFKMVYKLDDSITNDDLMDDDTITLNVVITIDYENCSQDELKSGAIAKITEGSNFMPTSMLTFTQTASTDEHQGLYRLDGTENDEYPIYFYRGGTNTVYNHVKFAGFCWRIIRTTNTGSIKMIYNGVPNDNGECNTPPGEGMFIGEHVYSTSSWVWNGNSIREYLRTWFFENLISYQSYIEDEVFCNDNQYDNGRISLECDAEHQVSVANGRNHYPIALITAEEANLCGLSSQSSSYGWLNPEGYTYQTMTGYSQLNDSVWLVNGYGQIMYYDVRNKYPVTISHSVRPVISLNSEVSISDGDGTSSNPYVIVTE